MAAHKERFDVGAQRVGALYAKALLGAAESAGAVAATVQELDALVTEVIERYADLDKVLASEMISANEKTALVDRVFGSRVSSLMLNFLKVLAAHQRLGFLRSIRSEFRRLYNESLGLVAVEVTTAAPLSAQVGSEITGRIRRLLGREPQVTSRVDPRLIGGVQVRVGDTVYDGSVAARLGRLREQMRQRSIERIETAGTQFVTVSDNGQP